MAKLFQVSDDNGSNWYTLPGGEGDINQEAAQISDTVFGQEYGSTEIGALDWSASAQAFYKGFAGYLAEIKQVGTATSATGEAMTNTTGKSYQITAATKRIWDRSTPVVVYDNAVNQTANVISIDYLFGIITFDAGYTITGPITVDVDYFPTAAVGKANTYSLAMAAEAVRTSDFATLQGNSGWNTYQAGLRTVGLDLSGIYDVSQGLQDLLEARSEIIIEIDPAGDGLSIARGFFKAATHGQSGAVGQLEEESVSFSLTVPVADDLSNPAIPFGWEHASTTTLSLAVRKMLTAWLTGADIDIQYLYDGTNGRKGDAVITDISMSGGIDAMNEFSASFQGDGVCTAVGTG